MAARRGDAIRADVEVRLGNPVSFKVTTEHLLMEGSGRDNGSIHVEWLGEHIAIDARETCTGKQNGHYPGELRALLRAFVRLLKDRRAKTVIMEASNAHVRELLVRLGAEAVTSADNEEKEVLLIRVATVISRCVRL